MTFREIIDQIGSSALAKALAVEESHVRVMKARDSIPPEYWGIVIDESAACGIEGVTHEALRNLRGTRFNRSEDVA